MMFRNCLLDGSEEIRCAYRPLAKGSFGAAMSMRRN